MNILLLPGIKPRVLGHPACRHSLYIDCTVPAPTSLIVDGKFVRFDSEYDLATTVHSPEFRIQQFDISEADKVILKFSLSSTRRHKISSGCQAEISGLLKASRNSSHSFALLVLESVADTSPRLQP
jgi:hypothetical protein